MEGAGRHQTSRPSRMARLNDSHSSSVRSTVTVALGSKTFASGSFRKASRSNGSDEERVSLSCWTSTVFHSPC